MKKSKVYTRTGDKGTTALVSGNRISKSDHRIDLYGELDELNSRMGFSASLLAKHDFKNTLEFIYRLQSAIFDLGSNMACEFENREKYKLPQISSEFVTELEKKIDELDSELEPLKSFVLPGGSVEAASLHLCRTNARSVERKLVAYSEASHEEAPLNGTIFLNRLSDFFFVLARYVNYKMGQTETLWIPGKN